MRTTIYILLLLLGYTAYSQSLSVFNIDASAFPAMKVNFYAFDAVGNQITNLSLSDFSIIDNGQSRTVTKVSCPDPKPPKQLSIVFAVDVTIYNDLNNAKSVLLTWLDMIQFPNNEVALISYDGLSYINQDFTNDKSKLTSAINSLQTLSSSEDHTGALIRPYTGAISIAQKARYKPIVIVLSSCSHFNESRKSEIIAEAQKNNTSINFVIFDRYDWTPEICQDIANQTGGFSNNKIPYNDIETAKASINNILATAQGGDPCSIEWLSGVTCIEGMKNIKVRLIPNNLTSNTSYKSPNSSLAKFEFTPTTVKFKNAIPGIKQDTIITVTARNSDFDVTNITSSNPAYTITPTSFILNSGQSRNLTISYITADSDYTFTKFTFENNNCLMKYYAGGGFSGKKSKIKTLNLINPNGEEVYAVGIDTIITWEGVLPDDYVEIEYTTNNGANWLPIEDSATGLSYKWLVPNTPSNQCLARVTAKLGYVTSSCNNGDVRICNQIWMGCNLDVECYRDGTPIPEVTDSIEWANLTTGAWCYYNNDPELGAIYGKLYNWYAVNDSHGLAPEGWHIPTDEEWTELENCLEGSDVAGGKLKSTEDGLWFYPNVGATNATGFSALPGGYRCRVGAFSSVGVFSSLGSYCRWWSSTSEIYMGAWGRSLFSDAPFIQRNSRHIAEGYSVRCIKDKFR